MAFRRSALEAVECPKRYFELYESEHPPDETSDAALRGIAFHAIAEVYIKRLHQLRLTADHEELLRAVNATIPALDLPPDLIYEVMDLVERWALTFELDRDAFLMAEETQRLEDEQVEWTPDLVYARDGELEQIDWKTYWIGLDDKDVKNQFQAQVYVWQASRRWKGFEKYRFTFVYPRLGTSATAVWTAEEAEALSVVAQSRIEIIKQHRESGRWPEVPGTHCGFCKLDCSIKDHASLDVQRIKTDEQAKAMADELIVLEKSVKARREAMQAWCGVHGDVEHHGIGFGYRPFTRKSYSADDVFRVFAEYGIENSGVELSATNLRGWVNLSDRFSKEYDGLKDRLMVLCKEKKRQGFKRWITR